MKDPLTRVWERQHARGTEWGWGEWAAAGRAEPEQQVLTVRCCGHW